VAVVAIRYRMGERKLPWPSSRIQFHSHTTIAVSGKPSTLRDYESSGTYHEKKIRAIAIASRVVSGLVIHRNIMKVKEIGVNGGGGGGDQADPDTYCGTRLLPVAV